jgi:hypothetical protein
VRAEVLRQHPQAANAAVAKQEKGSVGEGLARQAGLTARYAAEGLASVPGIIADPISKLAGAKPFTQWASEALTALGLPEPEGRGERLVGDVSRARSGGGGGIALARLAAPGAAGATRGVMEALASNPGMQAAAGGVAGGSAGVAREVGAPDWAQLLVGLSTGMITPAMVQASATATAAGARGARQLAKPFTEGGREEIAGASLNRLAANRGSAVENMADVPEYVAGSKPTAAQAARDPGLLQVERALAASDPQFAMRKSANNTARNAALDEIAGTKADVENMRAQRESDAARNYGAARDDVPKRSQEVYEAIADLEKRPAFAEAVKRAVVSLKNQGDDIARKGGEKAQRGSSYDPTKDDIIEGIRHYGGINQGDEAVGSLARANPFAPSPRGPVWAKARGETMMAQTRGGRSLDDMAARLREDGYPVSGPDDLMDAIANAGMGKATHSNMRDIGAAARADDPLASSIDKLVEQLATKGQAPEGRVDFAKNGVKLAHETKLQLDDMIEHATVKGANNDVRVLVGVRDKLLGALEHEDFSPAYRNARETYKQQSGPIDQLETIQGIRKGAALPGPDTTGQPVLSQAKWTNLVSKRVDELGERLTPKQLERMQAIGKDLDRASLSDTAGRAVGSNTFQNLSTANVLGAALGNHMANNAVAQTLMRPLQWLYRLPEQQVKDLLTEAMLDPSLARALMAKGTPTNVEYLGEALKFKARAIGIGATTGAAIETVQ